MTTTARDTILRKLRDALDRETPRADREQAVAAWAPDWQRLGQEDDPLAHFKTRAEAVKASVTVLEPGADLLGEISRVLADSNEIGQVRIANDPLLTPLVERDPGRFATGPADGGDIAAVSVATAALAETGAILHQSSPETPSLLAFLPALSIILVPRTRVLRSYEDAFALFTRDTLPRNLNFIAGPSRTGDIEEIIQIGAHGPKRLHIIVHSTQKD